MHEKYLAHYGVPGMKWGVRKSPERVGGGNRGTSNSGMSDQTKRRIKTIAGTAAKVGLVVGAGLAYRNPAVRSAVKRVASKSLRTTGKLASRGSQVVKTQVSINRARFRDAKRSAKKIAQTKISKVNSRRSPKIINPNSAKGAGLLNPNNTFGYKRIERSMNTIGNQTFEEVKATTSLGRTYVTRRLKA